MAGAGYKLFNTGDVLTAAQVNTYLQEQTVMVFASSAARTTALSGVLAEGMVSYLQDTNAVEVYNGSAWVGVSGAGDVTEVQAGTGISVASGTGPIPVVTNTMATAIDAKGDLVVGTGADTFARLAVGGTNGHTLQVDSSTATGLKWAAAAASGFVGCKAYKSGNQTIGSGAYTAVTYDLEVFDTDAFHNNSSNTSRFTIPAGKAGKYRADVQVFFNGGASPSGIRVAAIYKNGSLIASGDFRDTTTNESTAMCVFVVDDLVATDYLEAFVYHSQGSDRTLASGVANNAFTLTYLGA